MKTKSLGLAAIALGCSIVAEAQVAEPGSSGPSLQQMQQVLSALAQQHKASGAAVGAPSTGSRADINNLNAPVSLGWNFAHATNCGWFVDSSNNQWYLVFPIEGGMVFSINNPNVAYGLLTPCTNGNLFAWFVTNTSSGAFAQTFSYPYAPSPR
jgi:hypothetical protein